MLLQWQSDQLEAVSYISEGRGLMEEEVVVEFSPERFRMLETEETRRMIERRWEEARSENSRLYNASKYRLAGKRMEAGRLVLQVGLTDYKAQSSSPLSLTQIRSDLESFIMMMLGLLDCGPGPCWDQPLPQRPSLPGGGGEPVLSDEPVCGGGGLAPHC